MNAKRRSEFGLNEFRLNVVNDAASVCSEFGLNVVNEKRCSKCSEFGLNVVIEKRFST